MKLFAIGDLHLSHSSNKPMSIFGPNWDNHAERIAAAWRERVSDEDAVLIPGDISWAMQLDEARLDIEYIAALPGKKVIMRGNHDYWWGSISKVRDMLPCCMYALQNDTVELGSVTIAGSRGWICPGSSGFDPETDPPFNEKRAPSGFTEIFEKYGVERVIYGHLHGKACRNAFEGIRNGIEYTLCSADHLDFVPKLITEI